MKITIDYHIQQFTTGRQIYSYMPTSLPMLEPVEATNEVIAFLQKKTYMKGYIYPLGTDGSCYTRGTSDLDKCIEQHIKIFFPEFFFLNIFFIILHSELNTNNYKY